jgi:hypothetical protein
MRPAKFRVSPLSAVLFAAALTLPFASAARADIAISIDKSTQQMSVAVDGAERYTWPVSTGRPGYDTPNGTFKPNRMDADHFSQEWDNAPMPHTVFFDLHGHAIHGFFDVKHLGLAVSHGCVRLSPDHAATLFGLIKAEGMANTSVTIAGRTPGGDNGPAARQRQRQPDSEAAYSAQPIPVAPPQYQQPQYQQQQPQYRQQPAQYPQQPPPVYGQYGQPYGQPVYGQRYYGQPAYGQPYYGQPVYRQW